MSRREESQHRSSQRYRPQLRDDEDALTAAVIGLASTFGRYGYKRITGLLQMAGWNVNQKRVQRIWRSEGLKAPQRQPKRGRLWLGDGSCIRLRPEHANHVWAYDFVAERTHDGRPLKLLTVVDEYTRECLAIRVERRITANEVLWVLADLFLEYGIPEHIRSDNGPEFVAKAVRQWLAELGVKTLFIEPGSPWENGYVESFNDKLRDELLDGEIFYTLKEAHIVVADWRRLYNGLRPHSSLGQRPPAPETLLFAGFSLADYAPPSSTREVTLRLIWSVICQEGVPEPLRRRTLVAMNRGRRGERAGLRWRRAVSLICAGLAIRMTVSASGAALL
jgi:transposase InsO family protein